MPLSLSDEVALARATAFLTDDALIWTDPSDVIVAWNSGAERVYGWSAAEAIGQSIRLTVPAGLEDEEAELRRRVRAGEVVRDIETVRRRSDDTQVRVTLKLCAFRTPRGDTPGIVTIAQDVSIRERIDREARRLAAIVESSDDAIVSKDVNGIVTSWNAAAERMFGYTQDEMVGTSIRVLIPEDRQSEEDATLAKIRRGEKVEHFETLRRRKDGSLVTISLTVSPIHNNQGQVVGASKIARDITSLKEAESERLRLYASVQEASQVKDQFLATLSHELRTPLNAILGYARMLRSGMVAPEKQRRANQIIERNATSLTQIVEDVLDVSRIVSGKMRLDVQPVDLPEVVRGAVDAILPAADAKGVRVETVLDPRATPISGDPERLQQIFWNLLSNAVKFTNRGGKVQVRLARVDSHVEVSVSDSGVGIAAEFLPHIFERFRQADAGPTRERGGLGLGLAIARQLVEMHGGTIDVSSGGPGKGSTFRITVPQMIVHPADASERRLHPDSPSWTETMTLSNLSGLVVLAVDDDRDALGLVCEILEAAGARVLTANSAAEALEKLNGERPDVLVADLGMPRMDGFQLIERVRQHPERRVREVPAAALTAFARSEDRIKAVRAGFHVHLAKPIDPAELVTTIAMLGRHFEAHGA